MKMDITHEQLGLLIHAVERDIKTHDSMQSHLARHLKFDRIKIEQRQAALLREVLTILKKEHDHA